MSKQFWGVIAVILLIFAGVFVFGSNKSAAPGKTAGNSQLTEHIEGQGKSGVTLVEYGDYECPYCAEYYPIVKQVVAEFNQQIYFQFRNFPLVNIHQNAFASARAAEAAGLEGKFWEMHDMLYDSSNWQQWSTSSDPTPYFDQYAQEIGLNAAQFKQNFASNKVNNLINADMAEGNRLGISGTPAFFLDGKQVKIAATVQDFEKVINAEIAKKTTAATNASAASH